MLKKIQIKQLRIGMYIQELCTTWMGSPFWKSSFMLENQETLTKIVNAQILEVIIDTKKGADVFEEKEIVREVKNVVVETVIEKTQEPVVESKKIVFDEVVAVSMSQELERAQAIIDTSKVALTEMFHEARMGKAISTEKAQNLVEDIALSVMRNSGALIGLARLKTANDYTYMHSVAVCALMVSLARQLGLSDEVAREAGAAGLFHDIGKMAVPAGILDKPGKLTDEEFVSIKQHPRSGYEMLKEVSGISEMTLDVCLHHHEKVDGSGYPDKLTGDQISIYAKMGAVCDVYDAITSNRPYKDGWCPAESLSKMAEWSKGHFDEKVFQAFVKSVGIFPVGTLVSLQSGRLGVVVEQQAAKSLLKPKVRIFFSTRSKTYITPELIDLASPATQDKILSKEDAKKWGLKDINRYWTGEVVEQQ
jgi:putative nucleotidyltransferase with HDIG domain